MKKTVHAVLISFIFLFLSVSLTSCLDFDSFLSAFADTTSKSSLNSDVIVLARGDEGIIIDEPSRQIKQGSDVSFSFRVKEGYAYISHTKEASVEYDEKEGKYSILFSRVLSSFTFDIISMSHEDFYSVELRYNNEMGDVLVDGELFSPYCNDITLTATPKEGYRFTGFSTYNYIENHGDIVCEESTFSFLPETKSTIIYINFELIELPPPPEPYRVNVLKNATQGSFEFLSGSVEMTDSEEVSIKAVLPEDYEFLGFSSGGFLDAGGELISGEHIYTFTPIDKNTTIYLNFKRIVIMRHTIEIVSNHPDAKFVYVEGAPALEYPADVEIEASVPEGYVFSGFSKNAFLTDGGEALNRSTNYQFYADMSETVLYANYTKVGEYHIVYHSNGGNIVNSEKDYFTFTSEYNPQFMLQYTFHDGCDVVSFKREGYVLVGYSTKPVGDYRDYGGANYIPGFSNLGGICEVDRECGILILYCVWAKESSMDLFTYEEYTYTNMYQQGSKSKTFSVSGYRILSYLGNETTIVIPETINGINVIGIAPNVIPEGSEKIGKIVLPKTICAIEDKAFTGASGLVELVFFNALQSVYDSSFANSLMTLVINSQRYPTMSDSTEGSFIMKLQRVRYLKKMGKNVLIVVSGSSSLNGLNSRLLGELLNEEYEIVNYGTNAGANMLLYLQVLSRYTDDGDIVILAPEFTMNATFGANTFMYKTFRGNDQGYDIFREIDVSGFTSVFSAWVEYQKEAMPKTPSSYQNHNKSGMNNYGDLLGNRNKNSYTHGKASGLGKSYLNSSNAQRLNAVNQVFVKNGTTLLLSFAPCDIKQFTESSIANADLFAQNCANLLDFPVISNPATYFLEEQYIFNSAWHPNYQGANIRTVELAFDILRYFDLYTDSYLPIETRKQYNATEYPEEF